METIVASNAIRILQLEADKADATRVQQALMSRNGHLFSITRVERLYDAISKAQEQSYDLLLLELSLPDAQGLESLNLLQTTVPNVPIIVLTGVDDEKLALESVQAGAQDYLVKGQMDPHTLRRTILHAIERHRLVVELRVDRQRVHYLATHDVLTSLPNRHHYYDILARAVVYAERYERTLAVFLLDLNGFKKINDSLGHAAGDQLLTSVASRLKRCTRRSDTVARLGGDEFTVILPEIQDPMNATKAAERIIESFQSPFLIAGRQVPVTCAIGISLFPRDGKNVDSMISTADAAMYKAKGEGKNCYSFYNFTSNEESNRQVSLEKRLRLALERREFEVYYQPQIDIDRKRIVGAESLLRWNHPEEGLLPPQQFLTITEDCGLILPLGEWAIRNACKQNRAWQQSGYNRIRVSVNLSPRQFRQKELVKTLGQILSETGLEPRFLELEISETSIMENLGTAISTVNALRKMGVRVSINDFGSRHSSISSSKRLPVNALKIDPSLVGGITSGGHYASIIPDIVAMAGTMKCDTIAVGVETQEQLDFLQSHRCRIMQGHLFRKPMTADDMGNLLAAGEVGF